MEGISPTVTYVDVPYSVLVEPAPDRARAFARWCLAQSPRIETANASGSEVPSNLFTNMPEELLVGAHIDGRLYRHVAEPEPEPEAEAAPAKTTRRRKAVANEVTE